MNVDLYSIPEDNIIIYNFLRNKINEYISYDLTTTNIKCTISVNNIFFKNSKNCQIHMINQCIANSTKIKSYVIKVLLDNLWILPENIINNIIKELKIKSIDEIKDKIDKHVETKCYSSSQVNNNIIIDTMIINNCVGNSKEHPLQILFTNTGSAETNCYINTIDTFFSNNNNDNKNIKKEIQYDFNKIILYIVILFVFFITLSFLQVIKTNFTKIFKFKTIY